MTLRSFALGLVSVVAVVASLQGGKVRAQDATFTATHVWDTNANKGTVVLDTSVSGKSSPYLNVYIGAYDLLGVYTQGGGTTRFDAYCLDLTEPVGKPTFDATLQPTSTFTGGGPTGVSGANKGGAIAWLYNTYYNQAYASSLDSAALQLALWEVEYDWTGGTTLGGINLKGGNFQLGGTLAGGATDNDLISRANGFLSSWSGKQSEATFVNPTNPSNQPFVGPNNSRPVPEPGTVALLLPGVFAGLAIARRRK